VQFRWLILALGLGGVLLCSSALALSNTDYQKIRQTSTLGTIDPNVSLSSQLPALAGQTVEMRGVVSGVLAGEKCSTMLFTVGLDTVMVSYAQADPDITVDTPLRILAQAPAQGTILRAIIATPLNGASKVRPATAADAVSPVGNLQNANNYAQVPTLTPQPKLAAPSLMPGVTPANMVEMLQAYAGRIQQLNGSLDGNTAKTIAYHLLSKSAAYGVDPRLVFALVTQESRFKVRAVSRCGAMGLGQLMPGTAAALGVQHPFDIADNLDGSIRYLACQLQRFGHISLALAAYNAGPNRVENSGCQIPQISETQNYVSVIWRHYATLAGFDPESDGPVYTN